MGPVTSFAGCWSELEFLQGWKIRIHNALVKLVTMQFSGDKPTLLL